MNEREWQTVPCQYSGHLQMKCISRPYPVTLHGPPSLVQLCTYPIGMVQHNDTMFETFHQGGEI